MRKSTFILSLSLLIAGTGNAAAQTDGLLDRTGWTVTASSWQRDGAGEHGGEASCIIDGNDQTYWHSYYAGASNTDSGAGEGIPQWFIIDLGSTKSFNTIGYMPRPFDNQGKPANGTCSAYKVFVSDTSFGTPTRDEVNAMQNPAFEGTISYTGDTAPSLKQQTFQTEQSGRYVMFVITQGTRNFGSCAEFYLSQGTIPEKVNVTYNFKIGERTYTSTTVNGVFPGTEPTVSAPDYLTINSFSVDRITGETATVDVNCSENLPFVVSTSYTDNPEWQAINIHSNQGNYLWKYNASDNSVSTEITPAAIAEGVTDDKLWCITGNLIDGFKFYNKAAGEALTLWKENDGAIAKMSEATERNNFKLFKTTSHSIPSGFCFKLDGDNNYLNRQQNQLKGWTAKDEGSTCLTFSPASFVLNYANDASTSVANAPVGALGANTYLTDASNLEAYNEKINAVTSAPFDLSKVAELAEINKLVEKGASSAEITDGAYYRIVNAAYGSVLTANVDGLDCTIPSVNAARRVASTVFQITKDGASYKLSANNLFTGNVGNGNDAIVTLNETGTDMTITNLAGTPKFTFKQTDGGSYQYLHNAVRSDVNKVVGWETSAPATWWYIVPATDIEVAMNNVEAKTYATSYLPFAVSMPEGVKAYTGTVDGTTLRLSEVSGNVPAGTGVILVGNATSATLPIAAANDATATVADNALEGTYTDKAIDAASTEYYVLATKAGELGFWLPKEGTTTLKANKAYLPASALTASAVQAQGLRLEIGGVTGINTAITDNADKDAAIYDLTGRRVNKPAQGIYIVGGKKVLVK